MHAPRAEPTARAGGSTCARRVQSWPSTKPPKRSLPTSVRRALCAPHPLEHPQLRSPSGGFRTKTAPNRSIPKQCSDLIWRNAQKKVDDGPILPNIGTSSVAQAQLCWNADKRWTSSQARLTPPPTGRTLAACTKHATQIRQIRKTLRGSAWPDWSCRGRCRPSLAHTRRSSRRAIVGGQYQGANTRRPANGRRTVVGSQ